MLVEGSPGLPACLHAPHWAWLHYLPSDHPVSCTRVLPFSSAPPPSPSSPRPGDFPEFSVPGHMQSPAA